MIFENISSGPNRKGRYEDMKTKIRKNGLTPELWLIIGWQSFRLDTNAQDDDAEFYNNAAWYKEQLDKALARSYGRALDLLRSSADLQNGEKYREERERVMQDVRDFLDWHEKNNGSIQ